MDANAALKFSFIIRSFNSFWTISWARLALLFDLTSFFAMLRPFDRRALGASSSEDDSSEELSLSEESYFRPWPYSYFSFQRLFHHHGQSTLDLWAHHLLDYQIYLSRGETFFPPKFYIFLFRVNLKKDYCRVFVGVY